MNIVYLGIDNPISVAVPGYSCKSLIVTASHGKLTAINEPPDCGYSYNADTLGIVEFKISVKVKNRLKQIGAAKFRVKAIPDPVAFVGGITGGEIPLSQLKVQQGMNAWINGMDICSNFRVDSFNYAIVRDEKVIITGKNRSAYFDQDLKSHFSMLNNNDVILFYNIYCRGADRKLRKLPSIELKAVQ